MKLVAVFLRLSLAVLVFLTVQACKEQAPPGSAAPANTPAAAAADQGRGKIVFVYADTILAKYEDFAAKQAQLEQRQKQAEERIQGRMKALEREVQQIQAKVQDGTMAPNQIAGEQERIGRKEQEIMQERDRLGQQLLEETQRLNDELQSTVNAVLKAIQQEFGFDYILSYGPGTGVLMVNDSLDITDEVLRRLNSAPPTN